MINNPNHHTQHSHNEWVDIRNESDLNSERYLRAKDCIQDIVGDVNNTQVGKLSDLIKQYKVETEKNIKSNHLLTIIAIGITAITLIFQIIDVIRSGVDQSEIKIIRINSKI